MSDGLKTTFRVLCRTRNEAAVRVLIPALDSPQAVIREEALAALLTRRSSAGHREVLRRLHSVDGLSKEIIREHRARMTPTLRDAVLGTDEQLCANGCRAAVWFHEYDLIPPLVKALEDQANPNASIAGETLLVLVDALDAELHAPPESGGSRDPQLIRNHVFESLEFSVQRYGRHRRREVIEAFLLLVSQDNGVLRQILQDPHDVAFLVLVDVLTKSPRRGVIRLLLDLLDVARAPSAVFPVIAHRGDPTFVRHLLRKIGREPSAAVASNLKRIRSIGWLQSGGPILHQLDGLAQHSAVKLAVISAIPQQQALGVIEDLLARGKPGGRRAAAEALDRFGGADANALALRALDDEDPQVQASVLAKLRQRGIPGVLPRMVKMVDSPHAVVRQAARQSLVEFTFKRFLGTFDMLDEEVQRSTGMLVKKVDPQTIPMLRAEMRARARSRRLRALGIARAIDAVVRLEDLVIELLKDEDHMVRTEAASALGQSGSPPARHALREALADRSATVQEAAANSLYQQERRTPWQADPSGPPDQHGQAR